MNKKRRRHRLIMKEKNKLIKYENRKEIFNFLEQIIKEEFAKRFIFGPVLGAAVVGLMDVAEAE